MFLDPISLLLLVLFLFFIIPGPWLLLTGLRKLADPVPLYLPVLVSGIVLLVTCGLSVSGILENAGVLAGTLGVFGIMFLMVTLAVITPYCYFRSAEKNGDPWMILSLLAFIGNFLVYFTILDAVRTDRPLPLFGSRMIGSGHLLDIVISALGVGETVYTISSPFYFVIMVAALWLDVFIISFLYFWLLSLLPAAFRQEN